jgi:large subunit ribosomal protein L21
MFAIVNIAGQQFKVEKDQQIIVHRLEADEGKTLEFNDIVMSENNGKMKFGSPVQGATIKATVLGHLRGDKVIIFKKKRRKGYQKQSGHRQDLTRIRIESIAGI